MDTQAVVVCLAEMKLPEDYPLSYPRGFSFYLKSGQQAGIALEHWGVYTLVKINIANQLIPLHTGLQAVALWCQFDRLYSICNPAHLLSYEYLQTSLSNLGHHTSYLEISMPAIPFGGTMSLIRGGDTSYI